MTRSKNPSPTIRDVAKLANVSVATISRYINRVAPLAPETAERVQLAMQTLKYVPDSAARNLATRRTDTIGLMLSNLIGHTFFTPLLLGIERVTHDEGFNLLISSSYIDQPQKYLTLGKHNTDGLLVFLDSVSLVDLTSLYEKKLPMVLIHQTPPENLHIPCVTIENKASTRRLISHLIETHGRRRIVFLRGVENNEDSYWRETGYREALESHVIPFDQRLVSEGNFDRSVAQQSIERLIDSGVKFDAVFSGDDEAAIGVLAALHEHGFRVPEDIAVAGFDDQILSPFLSPSLTTIHAPTEEVGATAARQLIRFIRTGKADPVTLLPTDLIIRQSCGCKESDSVHS